MRSGGEVSFPRASVGTFALLLCLAASHPVAGGDFDKWPGNIQVALENTSPLAHERGERLPLYIWPARGAGVLGDADALELVGLLNERGIGLVSIWGGDVEGSLRAALPVARAQKKLGLRINIEATSLLYSFFNGDPQTAHIDEKGERFFDKSFGNANMGCAFGLEARKEPMRARLTPFVERYAKESLPVGFIWTDWEVDGPIEWNEAWSVARRCVRCRKEIPDIDTNFLAYQKALREIRSDLQRESYANEILETFPEALVGNYAMYPHNGYRYWLDYFEHHVDGQPALKDGRARYRHWYNEFEESGFTYAMPVLYTWYSGYVDYDFVDTDWRWFYNLLLVASNAGQHTPMETPIISFVHWHTTAPPKNADPTVKQFSEEKYREFLWHALLRGHDTFFLWGPGNELPGETRLLHPVWAAAQEYGEFLDNGKPVTFEVPKSPGPVVSGLRLGRRVLVRRTDFTEARDPVTLRVGVSTVSVPRNPGKCVILKLP